MEKRWVSTETLDDILGIDPDYRKNAAGWLSIIHPDDRQKVVKHLKLVFSGKRPFDMEYRVRRVSDGKVCWLHGRGELILDQDSQPVSLLGTIQDINSRKQAEVEKELLIDELQRAMAEVKTLSGFLPICSGCKKIRDDKGYWNQIEAYLRDNSEARFSHSLCPECAKKLYPEYEGLLINNDDN
jgi:PAS domain S-box-containing protein